MRIRWRVVAAFAALLFVAAACGDDGETGATSATGEGETAQAS
jgi:hypothetical protein